MKTTLLLQDTYTPEAHYKTYAGHHIAFLLRQNGFKVHVLDRFGLFTREELAELAYRWKGVGYLGISASFMFKQLASNLGTNTIDYNTQKMENLHYFIELLQPGQIVVGGATIHVPIENARHVLGKSSEADIYRAFDIPIPRYTSDIQTLAHRYVDDDFILPNETLPLELSRGCIFNCKFCSFGLRGRDKFDYNRAPELVADEIDYNRDKFGTTNYYLLCDTFNDTTMKIEGLVNVLARRKLKINFTSYLRHDLLHTYPEQIGLLKELGIRGAQFGLETFNHASGKSIGKGLHPDKVKDLLFRLKEEWSDTMLMSIFIVGLPHSDMAEHYATVDFIQQHNLLTTAMFYPLHLNRNIKEASEFSMNAEKYGYILDENGVDWKYRDVFTKQEAINKANELNGMLGDLATRGGAWHEMPYLRDHSWGSILNNQHTKTTYIDEYRTLLGLGK